MSIFLLLLALLINIGLSCFLFFVNIAEKDLLHLSISGFLFTNALFSTIVLIKIYRQYWKPMQNISAKTKEVLKEANLKIHSSEIENIAQAIHILQNTEQKTKWQNDGFQRLNELLSSSIDTNLEGFGIKTLQFFTKYADALAGCIYLLDDKKENFYPLVCKGFSIQKIQQQDLHYQNGLLGAVFSNQEKMYLTEVTPDRELSSSIFSKMPISILLIPLSVGQKKIGILELAFDKILLQYQIDFLDKVSFAIASALAEEIQELAIQRLVLAEQNNNMTLQLQEEELRQNIEELRTNQAKLDDQIRVTEKIKKELAARVSVLDTTAIVTESDLFGNITYANPKFCEVSQFSLQECMGKPHNIVRHPDNSKQLFKEMWDTIQGGRIFRGTLPNRAKDGSTYWVEANIAPVFDENGTIFKYIGVRFDVTQRILREQNEQHLNMALQTQEEELRQNIEELHANQAQLDAQVRITEQIKNELAARISVLNNSALLTESDMYGNITYVNEKFCQISKYSEQECLGKPHSLVRHPDTPKDVFKRMWETIKAGKIFQATYANLAKDGSTYWVEANIAPIFDENGKIYKYIGIRFDVTQRVLHQQEVQQMNESLQVQANKIEELLEDTLLRAEELQSKTEQLDQINETLEQKVAIRTTELQEQTEQLLFKNEQIEGSIRYAKRLQSALLPSLQELQNELPNSFLFRLPQHIVSGDFFWVETIGEETILILADCTGHGVPGAFMTILGNTLLNEIILQQNITKPNLILEELDKKLSATLKYQASKYQVADGMDAVVVVINQNQQKISFSGAKNPLYCVCGEEFHQFKGAKFPIGGSNEYYVDKNFVTEEIILKSPMMLYLATDGYQDQMGGEKSTKFMTKHFKTLLQTLYTHPIEEQQKILQTTFENWKKENKQTDDVTVIGIKI
jgi:PAS domain S-box-containing protein